MIPNPDGSRARCGGPGLCEECSREQHSEDLSKYTDVELGSHVCQPQCWELGPCPYSEEVLKRKRNKSEHQQFLREWVLYLQIQNAVDTVIRHASKLDAGTKQRIRDAFGD